ncbi:MAG: haloalkane dehalogenase [Bacteroidota bacterium]
MDELLDGLGGEDEPDEEVDPDINPEDTSGLVAIDPQLGDILRTPIEQFANLPGYDFEAHYVDVGESGPLLMHYIDEGPSNGDVVLLLHGNPSWSFVARDVVEPLVQEGFRVVVPDLIGFGKSDKPAERDAHTYDHHVMWLTNFIEELDLQGVTMHCQDWGGFLGLRIAIYEEARFDRIFASNTSLPDGTIDNPDFFKIWADSISQIVPQFSFIMNNSSPGNLPPDVLAAYDAPWPSEEYKAGPRQMPKEAPLDPTDPEAIENQEVLAELMKWKKPFMTVFTESIPGSLTRAGKDQLVPIIPGSEGQVHDLISDEIAGHYLREDIPVEIADYIIDFVRNN